MQLTSGGGWWRSSKDLQDQYHTSLPRLLRNQQQALNAAWPLMCERWGLSYHKIQALEKYFGFNGGNLGDAGVALAAQFGDSLEEEADSLSAKIQELEEQGQSVGDLSWQTKAMLGALVICAFTVVAAPLGLALAGGITVAAASTQAVTTAASIGASALVAALYTSEQVPAPSVPPPRRRRRRRAAG